MFAVDDFHSNGAFVIPGFATSSEVHGMKVAMNKLIDGWDPKESRGSVFVTTEEQHIRNSYFLDSSQSISFFLEEDSVDARTGEVKDGLKKDEIINKAGHALHVLEPVFRDYCHSSKVLSLVSKLGYTDPLLPQTMYIFKQPRIGGVVTSHQDSTFLHTEPRQTCLGLWLALDDADTNNGCLWFRPGSHTEPLRRRFVRNPQLSDDPNAVPTVFVDVFRDESKWEGELPGSTPEELITHGFIPVPVKAGDLVGIHGLVDHLSLANTSGKPRHSFQAHFVEGPAAGITWSHDNWLQYKGRRPFERMLVRE